MSETAFQKIVHPNYRPGLPLPEVSDSLGLLSGFQGTWVGTGFNLISLPDFDKNPPSTGPQDFRLKLNATTEVLEFTPIGGFVPNRGSVTSLGAKTGQPDINISGLTYLQRVSDLVTHSAMHIEPGIWLNVPASEALPTDSFVRMGNIPHGDSLLAQSTFATDLKNTDPVFAVADSTPTGPGVDHIGYLDPFLHPPLPPGMEPAWVKNLNLALENVITLQKAQGMAITDMVVIAISTAPQAGAIVPAGGILNIPFVIKNANAIQMDATFWIETVTQKDGPPFMQLQYTQTVILNFLGINWPHISVATLVKQ